MKDAAVRAKFSAADIIYPLIRKKKLSLVENIIDIVVQPGTLHLADRALRVHRLRGIS